MMVRVNRSNEAALSQERLRDVLYYNPNTGVFVWRVKKVNKIVIGKDAGFASSGGYRRICIDYITYQAHRLAWLYVYGRWPKNLIDHINGNRADNRIVNLREVTQAQNSLNRVKNKATGMYPGVNFEKGCRKYSAKVSANGRRHYLGVFATPEEANDACIKFRQKNTPDAIDF